MTHETKDAIMRRLVECLKPAHEIRKIVVFGSFVWGDSPNDMDVAVFVDSDDDYLPLALKYRELARPVSQEVPLDIIPVRPNASGAFMDEIGKGELIYER